MKRLAFGTSLFSFLIVLFSVWSPANAEIRLGGGVHYWTALSDIEVNNINVTDNGASFIGSVQWVPGGLISLEGNLEYFTDGFGGANAGALSPQAFILLGGALYGGLGIGITYNDQLQGSDWTDPFYTARVGLDIELLPRIHLDIHANYLFNSFTEIDGADTDSITLGAIGRIALW